MATMEFWYSIGSTYTYLTVNRISKRAAERGVTVTWHPFDVRAIMIEMQNIPFRNKPAKSAYMWRDIARQSDRYGLSPALPAPYPLEHLPRINQVALIALTEGWGEAFTRAAYHDWFEAGIEVSQPEALAAVLRRIGQDAEAVLARADAPQTVQALQDQTETAKAKGVFGAPSFVVGTELFWGDDRLDHALDWAATQ